MGHFHPNHATCVCLAAPNVAFKPILLGPLCSVPPVKLLEESVLSSKCHTNKYKTQFSLGMDTPDKEAWTSNRHFWNCACADNNDNTFGAALLSSMHTYTPHVLSAPSYSWYSYLATATSTGSITDSTAQDDIPEKAHQPVN